MARETRVSNNRMAFWSPIPARSNLPLIVAIASRETQVIDKLMLQLNSSSPNHFVFEQHHNLTLENVKELQHRYGALLEKPILFALELCNLEHTETTPEGKATRYDVLFTLAKHFDALQRKAHQTNQAVPNLEDIIRFAKSAKNEQALNAFYLGLSNENKLKANRILDRITPKLESIAPTRALSFERI